MKKISKSMKISIILGVFFGLFLLFVKLWFQLSVEEMIRLDVFSSIAFVLINVIINISYNLFYGRKINALMPLLGEAKYEEYLEKITAIRDKVKSKHLRAIAELNRTAALTGKKEYGTAVEILKELEPRVKKMPSVEMVRRLNLCLNYFYLKDYEEAETIYKIVKLFLENTKSMSSIKRTLPFWIYLWIYAAMGKRREWQNGFRKQEGCIRKSNCKKILLIWRNFWKKERKICRKTQRVMYRVEEKEVQKAA